MIISTSELMLKYSNYKVPKMKIKREIEDNVYFEVKRGLYETDSNVDPMLLSGYICSPSYLSFEYALSLYGLIPETVYTYTSATFGKRHIKSYTNKFGNYSYQDIPKNAYVYGIMQITQGDYSYVIATKEKALCDMLYISKPARSIKELKHLIFDSLRIDEYEFYSLCRDDLLFLSKLYKCTNLKLLYKILKEGHYNG